MNIATWIKQCEQKLKAGNISSPHLDTLILLEDELQLNRSVVLAHPENIIPLICLKNLETKIARRAAREPLAYIRGFVEFYGQNFVVNEKVLIPRAESESIIDIVLKLDAEINFIKNDFYLIDVGTGSGCLAISVGLKIPNLNLIATDISLSALKIARQNVKNLGTDITFYRGDLLSFMDKKLQSKITINSSNFVIIANLPYVPTSFKAQEELSYEPQQALYGGNDGLELYHQLFNQIVKLKLKPKFIITESLESQHQELSTLAKKSGFNLQKTNCLTQLFKLA